MIRANANKVQSQVALLLIDIALLAGLLIVVAFSGCDRKEKVMEVNTPDKNVEVTHDKDTGKVDVTVHDKK